MTRLILGSHFSLRSLVLSAFEVTSTYSTQISKKYPFSLSIYPDAPPKRYWYDDGRLRGWLYLESYILDAGNGRWIAY